MLIYVVNVQQVYSQPVLVRADNEQDAIQKVDTGEGEELDQHAQYAYTLDPGTWTVQLYEEDEKA